MPRLVPKQRPNWGQAQRKFLAMRKDLMLPSAALSDMVYVGMPMSLRPHIEMDITVTLDLSSVSKITRNRLVRALRIGVLPCWSGKAADIFRSIATGAGLKVVKYSEQCGRVYANFQHTEFRSDLEVYAALATPNPYRQHTTGAYFYDYANESAMYGYGAKIPVDTVVMLFKRHIVDDAWLEKSAQLARIVEEGGKVTVTGSYHDARYTYDYR